MNKSELISAVAEKTNNTKTCVESVLNEVLEQIKGELSKNGSVALLGFGTFSTQTRKATECRNPKTGEKIKVAEKVVAKFKPSKSLM